MYSVVRKHDSKVMAQFGSYDRADQYLDACVNPYFGVEQPEEYKGTNMDDYTIELRKRVSKEELGHKSNDLL